VLDRGYSMDWEARVKICPLLWSSPREVWVDRSRKSFRSGFLPAVFQGTTGPSRRITYHESCSAVPN
jgi:hypothetical protein